MQTFALAAAALAVAAAQSARPMRCNSDDQCRLPCPMGQTGHCAPQPNSRSGVCGCASGSNSPAGLPAGSSCGGMMRPMPGVPTSCADGLECVNTMGPMIMDAGGSCGPVCPNGGGRDQWGNCIDSGCRSWFDGCNTCEVDARGNANSCTEMMCYQVAPGSAECRDSNGAASTTAGPPAGCTTWFDGCNTCGRDTANAPMMCTMMACFRQGASECRGWAAGYGPAAATTNRPTAVEPPVRHPVDPLPDPPVPAGAARCSTTVTRGSRGSPCPAGQTCVITDLGHPEFDQPNSGHCSGGAAAASGTGNAACWGGAYTFARCCRGATGDSSCWSGSYNYNFCCTDSGH